MHKIDTEWNENNFIPENKEEIDAIIKKAELKHRKRREKKPSIKRCPLLSKAFINLHNIIFPIYSFICECDDILDPVALYIMSKALSHENIPRYEEEDVSNGIIMYKLVNRYASFIDNAEKDIDDIEKIDRISKIITYLIITYNNDSYIHRILKAYTNDIYSDNEITDLNALAVIATINRDLANLFVINNIHPHYIMKIYDLYISEDLDLEIADLVKDDGYLLLKLTSGVAHPAILLEEYYKHPEHKNVFDNLVETLKSTNKLLGSLYNFE